MCEAAKVCGDPATLARALASAVGSCAVGKRSALPSPPALDILFDARAVIGAVQGSVGVRVVRVDVGKSSCGGGGSREYEGGGGEEVAVGQGNVIDVVACDELGRPVLDITPEEVGEGRGLCAACDTSLRTCLIVPATVTVRAVCCSVAACFQASLLISPVCCWAVVSLPSFVL